MISRLTRVNRMVNYRAPVCLTQMTRRFEGQYISYPNHADKNLIGGRKNLKIADDCLDESEVVTRMMFVINNFTLFDLETVDWSKPFEEQGIDSLESVALLTSLEHEFHTVFEDNLFDSFETFD